MTDLAAWLLQQLAEDERQARAATTGPWRWQKYGDGDHELTSPADAVLAVYGDYGYDATLECEPADREHIAAWDPARVLAECEAKRRIMEGMTQPDQPTMFGRGVNSAEARILRLLALPYADRPGYNEAW